MSIIWVIEKLKPKALAPLLMGQFPIRAVASIKNLARLKKINSIEKPSLFIIDWRDFSLEEAQEFKVFKTTSQYKYLFVCHQKDFNFFSQVIKDTKSNYVTMIDDKFRFDEQFIEFIRNMVGQEDVDHRMLQYQDMMFDFQNSEIKNTVTKESEFLTQKEAKLLYLFLKNIDKTLSREEIKKKVWPGVTVSSRTIDSHISRLRKRTESFGVFIEAAYGNGYSLR